MREHSLEAVKELDGKIFAMLTDTEMEVLNIYRAQGRKYGVSATVEPTDDAAARLRRLAASAQTTFSNALGAGCR